MFKGLKEARPKYENANTISPVKLQRDKVYKGNQVEIVVMKATNITAKNSSEEVNSDLRS